MTDNKGQTCRNCEKGVYDETSIYDDWDGVLHCTECGARVARYSDNNKLNIKTLEGNEMQTISITRALVELKRYESRINQAIGSGVFSGVSIGLNADQVVQGSANQTVEQRESEINASFQKVEQLIQNRSAIKAAIVKSNAETVVTFRGQSMSVAAAIELKGTLNTREYFLQTVRQQYSASTRKVEEANRSMRDEIDRLIGVSGEKSAVNKAQIEVLEDMQKRKKFAQVISDGATAKKIEDMVQEINDIKSELDYLLTETNSRTTIDVAL